MEPISIHEILIATDGKLISGNTDEVITSVCIDSRNVKKGSLFIPIKGEKVDGHDFIKSAFENGAVVSFFEKGYEINNNFGSMIEVESTKNALMNLAKYYRHKFDIPIIGVSGSVGKTTTKEMIASAIGETINVLKTEGNYNGQIGLPLTIFNINKEHQAAVLEMGVSEFGEMDRLAEIADIDIGVITNIGLSHIENFKSIENTCLEKLKMIKKETGVFYLNGDSPILKKNSNNLRQKVVYFGLNGDYDYKCEDVYSDKTNTYFTLSTEFFKETISIPCLGIHNVYNALVAIAVALNLGVHMEDIKTGLSKFNGIAMRQQISDLNGIILIDDSYNASPDSVKGSVGVLKNICSSGRNIAVLADMLELGEKSEKIHFDTGRYIAIEGIDLLITVGEKAEFFSKGANSVNKNTEIFNCKTNLEAFEFLKNNLYSGDKVLVKGSRGMHTDKIVKMIKEKFS